MWSLKRSKSLADAEAEALLAPLPLVAEGTPSPAPPERGSADAFIRPTVYGSPTTFGTQPWWSSRGWWKLASTTEANDVRADVGTHGPLAVGAVSVRGNKHRLQGLPNQDTFAVAVHRHAADGEPPACEEFLVVAVSDGMGSAAYSHFSSRLVAHNLVEMLRQFGERMDLASILTAVRDRQEGLLAELTRRVEAYRAHEFQAPPKAERGSIRSDLQTTLTFAVLPLAESEIGSRRALLGFVGDSPAFLIRRGSIVPVEPAKSGEGLWSSSTQGVLGATSMVIADVEIPPGSALMLTSDGVGNFLTFDGVETELGIDLSNRWATPVGVHEMVRDVSFELQSADDDRTAVVVWFRGQD